jgi:hypothetical protein
VYDCDYREGDIDALDTPEALTEQGADSPGSFDVPMGARMLTGVYIAAAPDWTADAMYGFSSAVKLSGGGIDIGEGYFPGPVGGTCGAAATSSGAFYGQPQKYKTKIPVIGGGPIKADACIMGEDPGAVHLICALEYDGEPGKIIDMDYREGNLAAANTLVNLDARHGATERDFDVSYSKIGEVHFAAGLKAVAGPLRFAPVLHLSGPALKVGGNYRFLGPSGGVQDDIAISGDMVIQQLTKYDAPIDVNKGNKLRAQAQMLEDDAGTAYAIVGIGYLM